MARDLALLEGVSAGSSPPTLRLYAWTPPCLSLGRHQPDTVADLAFCRRHGLDVVRRPTGGRAVLHHLELTYAVVAPLGRGPLPLHLQDTYRRLCGALVRACTTLGVPACLTSGDVNLHLPGPRSNQPCFKQPAGGEVVVGARKLVGSASRTHRGAILQHGAILLDWDGALQAGAMGLPDDRSLRPHITTFAEQLGRAPTRDHLERVITAAFVEELGVDLEPGELTAEEAERARELEQDPALRVG
jgi:lipoate-protein ligase A